MKLWRNLIRLLFLRAIRNKLIKNSCSQAVYLPTVRHEKLALQEYQQCNFLNGFGKYITSWYFLSLQYLFLNCNKGAGDIRYSFCTPGRIYRKPEPRSWISTSRTKVLTPERPAHARWARLYGGVKTHSLLLKYNS